MALSIEDCRLLLEDDSYSDKQIIQLRDTINAVACGVINRIVESKREELNDDIPQAD